MKKMMMSKKGFTLTELIIVVSILGLLAAVATPSLLSYIDQGKNGADTANKKIMEDVISRKLADTTLTTDAASLGNYAVVKPLLIAEIGTIPTPKFDPTKVFAYNKTTGKISIVAAAVDPLIEIVP
jgi:prepilin-type N-terminal cleavage/methylation domain-containing protein